VRALTVDRVDGKPVDDEERDETMAHMAYIRNFEQARAVTDSVLVNLGFALLYRDPWTGTAERGDQTSTMLLGSFAGESRYVKIGIAYRAVAPDQTVLFLSKVTTGWSGGLVGSNQMDRIYGATVGHIDAALASSGQLMATAQGWAPEGACDEGPWWDRGPVWTRGNR